MKTFIISESVPAMLYRSITVQAENEEDAVHKYLENPSDYEAVIEQMEEHYDNAVIDMVEEEPEA